MLSDLRLAALRLGAAPISTLVAIGCLALGLAAAIMVYSVIDQVVLRPSSIARGEDVRLLELELRAGGQQQSLSNWSYPAFEALRDTLAPDYTAIAVTRTPLSLTLATAGGAERIRTEIVSPGYFQALGVTPVLGGEPGAQAETAADTRIWLSHSLWRDSYAADPAVLGRQVSLQGMPFVVAGVLPAGFQGISEQSAAFIPMSAAPSVTFANRLKGATSFWHAVMVVPAAAQAAALDARLAVAGERVRDAIDRNDLPTALGYALADRMAKAEIDGFNQAITERLGERTLLTNAAREPSGKLFDKAADGLARGERQKLAEAWPVMRAAQQIAAHERTVETLKQTENLRLSQRQTPVLKQ